MTSIYEVRNIHSFSKTDPVWLTLKSGTWVIWNNDLGTSLLTVKTKAEAEATVAEWDSEDAEHGQG